MSFLACFGTAQCIAAAPVQEHVVWRQVGITADSGAADSVADPGCFPGYEVKRHAQPVYYELATGEPTTLVDEHRVARVAQEGLVRGGMKLQATERVRKHLAAAKRTVDAGHAAVFAPEEIGGWYIVNLKTLEAISLRESEGELHAGCVGAPG